MFSAEQKQSYLVLAEALGRRAIEQLPELIGQLKEAYGRHPLPEEVQCVAGEICERRFLAITAAVLEDGGSEQDAEDIVKAVHDAIRDAVIGPRH